MRMVSLARASIEQSDGSAFAFFLREALELHLAQCNVASAFASYEAAMAEAPDKTDLTVAFQRVLERAQYDGEVRSEFSIDDLEHLVCGIEFAVRMCDPRTQTECTARYLQVVLLGLRP